MINSLWHTANKTEIRTASVPDVSNEECKVSAKYSMISLGTETLVIHKKIPETIQDYMRVPYMEGSFNLPIKYGYALAGTLDDGEKVHFMHPHQDTCIVSATSVFRDCQELPLKRIPLISNLETVINAIWDCNLDGNKTIVVCGFGNIGSLLAVTLKYHYHIDVKIIETNAWRKQKAVTLGFEVYNSEDGFDIAFNTSSNEKALQFCIDHANEEAEIIELSWYGDSTVKLQLGENFHKNRLRLVASQVSKIPIKKRGEFDYYKRKQLAVTILKNSIFDELITTIIPFKEAPLFFNSLRDNTIPEGLIYLIKY